MAASTLRMGVDSAVTELGAEYRSLCLSGSFPSLTGPVPIPSHHSFHYLDLRPAQEQVTFPYLDDEVEQQVGPHPWLRSSGPETQT